VLTRDRTDTLTIGADLPVRRLGFGAMRLTGAPAWLDRPTAIGIVRRAVELGVTFTEEVLDYCQQRGVAFIPWLPVAPRAIGAAGPITSVAGRLGATPTQVALAWLLHRSPVMLPIPGTSSRAHLEENAAAADLSLSAGDLAQLATA
jgi:pyridoxine 4-dehydrogenase